MAVNPALTTSLSGALLPARFEGEMFALERHGVEIELDGLGNSNAKWKAKGFLCLSTIRIVFVKDNRSQSDDLAAFDIPLAYVHKDEVKQPILGCNHLSGLVWPAVEGGGPHGVYPPIRFKLYFTNSRIGTFLRMYLRLVHDARTALRRQQPHEAPRKEAPSPNTDFMSAAFVDPDDPSTLFLTQPIPDSSCIPGPRYDSTYKLPIV